jgi:uncharacterized membrane protein
MDLYYYVLNVLRTSLLLLGSVVIFIGIAQTTLEAVRTSPGLHIPRRIMDHIALGLEFFVGAGLLNLILNPTWASVQVAALIIIVRKLITLSLDRLPQKSSED